MKWRQFQSVFRPLVRRSWLSHCREAGVPDTDLLAYRAWYEDKLLSDCGMKSSRDARPADFYKLLSAFGYTPSASVSCPTIRGFTPPQNAALADLIQKAWRAASFRQEYPLAFDAWIEVELEASGISNHTAADRIEAFDNCIAHFAVIAGDDYWISRTAEAAERRMRFVIRGLLRELDFLAATVHDWNYCRAIYVHMSLPLTIEEAPAVMLWKVLQALDSQVRRLRKSPCVAALPEVHVPF